MTKNKKIKFTKEDVYKVTSQIKEGYFSTYKLIAKSLNSPKGQRGVAHSLKIHSCKLANLEHSKIKCDKIHCYRVINSDYYIGGYIDKFGKNNSGKKINKLNDEGIEFDKKGYVKENNRWRLFTPEIN